MTGRSRLAASPALCWAAWILFGYAVLAPGARADSLTETFERGVSSQVDGQLGDAASAYEKLIESGVDDPNVYFNLAGTYARLGQYGQAIRQYERVLRCEPGDAEARAGLTRAIEAIGNRQARQYGEAIVSDRPPLLDALYSPLKRDVLAQLLWGSAWAFALAALLLLRQASEAVRIALGILCTFSALLAGVAGLGLAVKREFGAEGAAAVVIVPELSVRQGPEASSEKVAALLEGTRLRVLERRGSSVLVQLADGRTGLARASDVGEL
jgi:tetratricopeptide (TPR) repeat protein